MHDKSIYFRIPKTGKEGFLVQYDDLPYFYSRLHHHPELQLVYILDGRGDLFISDTITSFEPGKLFLIGSNQSHMFKCDRQYYEEKEALRSRSISVFFHERSLGEGFLKISEMSTIKQLIDRSERGIHFSSKISGDIGARMPRLLNLSGFPRFLEILDILNELAKVDEYEYLATTSSADPLSDNESLKVNNVINYIFSNYRENIKLEVIAEIANYSEAAFCHFFKQRTRKTFTQFLNEVRVSQACKMLKDNELNISEVCFECGFNNVSNFNRQFKKVTGFSPTAYKKKYKDI